MSERDALEQLEAALAEGRELEASVAIAFVAASAVDLDEDELRAALRRAMLLLAAGGDPTRDLEPDGRAVTALAADLDSAQRRAALAAGLDRVARAAGGLPLVEGAAARLRSDLGAAWRTFACALLADELGS